MSLSVIVIGYNSEHFLSGCFKATFKALDKLKSKVDEFEIIYVDSGSNDNSLEVAKQFNIRTAIVHKGESSAALGRTIGIRHAKYENLLFLDSDFVLEEDWLLNNWDIFENKKACVGERAEYLWESPDAKPKLVTSNFYGFERVEPIDRIGGFLLISRQVLQNLEYNPFFKTEEEGALYSEFYSENQIYSIPSVAYAHLNRKRVKGVLMQYLTPDFRCDYIGALILCVMKGNVKSAFAIFKDYIIALSFWALILFLFLFETDFFYLLISFIIILLLAFSRRPKSVIASFLFFPLKLYAFCARRLLRQEVIYSIGKERFKLEGYFFEYSFRKVD